MSSHLTEEFIHHFRRLPDRVQQAARRDYKTWKSNPSHPGLEFKKVRSSRPIYSVRIGIHWRALGLLEGDSIIWFWIGPHATYDRLLSKL